MNSMTCTCSIPGSPCPIHKLVVFRKPDGSFSKVYRMRRLRSGEMTPSQRSRLSSESGLDRQPSYYELSRQKAGNECMMSCPSKSHQQVNKHEITTKVIMPQPRGSTISVDFSKPREIALSWPDRDRDGKAPPRDIRVQLPMPEVKPLGRRPEVLPRALSAKSNDVLSTNTKSGLYVADSRTSMRKLRIDVYNDGSTVMETRTRETTIYKPEDDESNAPGCAMPPKRQSVPAIGPPGSQYAIDPRAGMPSIQQMSGTNIPSCCGGPKVLPKVSDPGSFIYNQSQNFPQPSVPDVPSCCKKKSQAVMTPGLQPYSNELQPYGSRSQSVGQNFLPSTVPDAPSCCRKKSQPMTGSDSLGLQLYGDSRQSYSDAVQPYNTESMALVKKDTCQANEDFNSVLNTTLRGLDQAVETLKNANETSTALALPSDPQELNKALTEKLKANQQHIHELVYAMHSMLKELQNFSGSDDQNLPQMKNMMNDLEIINARSNQLAIEGAKPLLAIEPAPAPVATEQRLTDITDTTAPFGLPALPSASGGPAPPALARRIIDITDPLRPVALPTINLPTGETIAIAYGPQIAAVPQQVSRMKSVGFGDVSQVPALPAIPAPLFQLTQQLSQARGQSVIPALPMATTDLQQTAIMGRASSTAASLKDVDNLVESQHLSATNTIGEPAMKLPAKTLSKSAYDSVSNLDPSSGALATSAALISRSITTASLAPSILPELSQKIELIREPDIKQLEKPTIQPESSPPAEVNLQPEVIPESEPTPELSPSSQPDPKTSSDTELATEQEAVLHPESATEPEPSTRLDPTVEPEVTSAPEPAPEPEFVPEPESVAEQEPVPEPEPTAEPDPAPEAEPASEL